MGRGADPRRPSTGTLGTGDGRVRVCWTGEREDRYREAEEAFQASIPLLAAIGGDVHCSFAYRYMGRLSELRGDHDASSTAIEAALALARDLGVTGLANVLLTDLGAYLAAKRDFEGTRRVLEQPLVRLAIGGRRPASPSP